MGAVSYRNAKPLVYGIGASDMMDIMELSYDYPARLVDRLREGAIDIGLIPVAAIPSLPGARIVGAHGIAADGKVGSVALFSQSPIEEVEEVILDYQSRTSVALTRILFRDHWQRPVQFVASEGDEYIQQIQGRRAGLIIGDRALQQTDRFPFVYDLAENWNAYTGLPFVFAAWVATRALSPDLIARFEQANERGLDQLALLADQWALPGVDMLTYYRDRIHYRIDPSKKEGMEKFLSLLAAT